MQGRLTREHLASLPAREIPWVITEAISDLFGDDYEREYETVMMLPRCLRVVYTTGTLADEVNNGGFNQYFWNQDARFVDEAAEGFIALGCEKLATLSREALEAVIAEAETQFAARDRVGEVGSLQAFSDLTKVSTLGELDHRFYALSEGIDLLALQGNYVLAHLDELTEA